MAKPKDNIQELIEQADINANEELASTAASTAPLTVEGLPQPADVAPGMIRVHLVSPSHHDGKAKKTWLRDSVFEIDEATARIMIDELKCAYPTTEPINEILTPYEGK